MDDAVHHVVALAELHTMVLVACCVDHASLRSARSKLGGPGCLRRRCGTRKIRLSLFSTSAIGENDHQRSVHKQNCLLERDRPET